MSRLFDFEEAFVTKSSMEAQDTSDTRLASEAIDIAP
jgi:hypothetical protein